MENFLYWYISCVSEDLGYESKLVISLDNLLSLYQTFVYIDVTQMVRISFENNQILKLLM
jgi:hypothetical protein